MWTAGQIIRFMTVRFTEALIVTLLVMFMPNIPPFCKISDSIPVTPTKPFFDKLSLNDKLNDVQIWHKGDFYGPEAFADYNGELYTSLHTGEIVKLVGEQIIPIVKFGKPCKGFFEEKICGRPLGIQFDKDGSLIAADAYYGIFRVDVKTGEKIQLISPDDEIKGKKPKIPNGVAIASNGDIYWTDSSTEFYLEDGMIDMFSDGSGRLIHYNVATKENTVLMDNLLFANGVALSEDEEYVLVAETGRSCIYRYYLKGPKKTTTDRFFDGLPGLPDNLKADGQGGFFVPLITARDDYTPMPTQILGSFPLFRKLIARVMGLTELAFSIGHQIYPSDYFLKGLHLVGHFSIMSFVLPSRVTIIHLSKDGEVLDSFHGHNRKATGISEAHIFGDFLYLGSPLNDYIARIPLNKLGLEYLKSKPEPVTEKPKEVPTIKSAPPPPTTTKPPPTTTTTPPPVTTTKPPPTTAAPLPTTTPPPVKTTKPPPTTTKPPPTTTKPPSTTTKPPPTTPKTDTASAPKVTKPEPTKAQPTAKPTVKTSETKATPKPTEAPKTAPKTDSPQGKPTTAQPKQKEAPSQNKVPK